MILKNPSSPLPSIFLKPNNTLRSSSELHPTLLPLYFNTSLSGGNRCVAMILPRAASNNGLGPKRKLWNSLLFHNSCRYLNWCCWSSDDPHRCLSSTSPAECYNTSYIIVPLFQFPYNTFNLEQNNTGVYLEIGFKNNIPNLLGCLGQQVSLFMYSKNSQTWRLPNCSQHSMEQHLRWCGFLSKTTMNIITIWGPTLVVASIKPISHNHQIGLLETMADWKWTGSFWAGCWKGNCWQPW